MTMRYVIRNKHAIGFILGTGPKGYRAFDRDGEIASVIAGRLTRELRSALRGKNAPVQGFDSKIEYPNRGKI